MRNSLSGISFIQASMIRKSSSSSSTIKILVGRLEANMITNGLIYVANVVIFFNKFTLYAAERKRNDEHRSLSRSAKSRDESLVHFDDLFAKRQPDARAFILRAGMQPAEHIEDLFGIFLIKPDAII